MPLSGETPIDISNSAVVPEDNVILGGDLLVISPKKNFDSLFLSYYISNCKKKEIAKKSNGISIIHSHKEDIERLIINYPSYEEQCNISKFIKLIVIKIKIILKRIETLKKYKEGLCNYFFKIEENDHHQLKEYVNNYASQLLTKDIDHNIGEYPVYDASGSPYKNIDFYQQDKDTISIIKYGSGCGRTFISRGYHSILGTMTDLIPNQNVDVYFIYAFTLSKYFKSIVKKYIEIGTTPNLYYSDYSKAIISNKALCSCKSISIIINTIESKEKLLSNELKELNVIKKDLLNKMFI